MTEDVGTTARGHLSTRRKLGIWEREKGLCMMCSTRLQPGKFIYEHVRALELGGTDTDDNIRLTCLPCAGVKKSKNPLPGGKGSKWKKKMDGSVVRRDD